MRPTQQKQWQFSNTVNKQDERERERGRCDWSRKFGENKNNDLKSQ